MLAYHLAIKEEFDPTSVEYAPKAFLQEGFIHLTRRKEILHEVANRYYKSDTREYLIFTVDLARCPSMWRYDAPGDEYPHLYGHIPTSAITQKEEARRASDGTFLSTL
jgi:uncharacterized protein (DUF952 family)